MKNKRYLTYPIMFDLDGTLFQAHLLSLQAYQDAFASLVERGLWPKYPKDEEITGIYGMTDAEIWPKLMPGAEPQLRREAASLYLESELARLERGDGETFPGSVETLATLHQRGHQIFVVSNGGEHYVKEICRRFGLAPYLTGIYSAGQFKTVSKKDLLAKAIHDHRLSRGMMVGDRSSDISAGQANGFITVGCTFGYGRLEELKGADYLVDRIGQILDLAGKESGQ